MIAYSNSIYFHKEAKSGGMTIKNQEGLFSFLNPIYLISQPLRMVSSISSVGTDVFVIFIIFIAMAGIWLGFLYKYNSN